MKKHGLFQGLCLCLCFLSVSAFCAPKHVFDHFICTDYSQGKVLLFEDGQVVWEHEAPMSNDVWLLPNGNMLFTTGHGVLEVTRAQDTVFCYRSDSHVFACQRLRNGNTFVGECNAGRLLEIAPDGRIVHEVCILPEGVTDAGMGFIRNARRLRNGHFLVAHYAGKKVVEYDADGRIVWEAPVSGGAHSVMRLRNGDTMVSAADADRNPRLLRYDRKGRLIWELSNKDLPGEPFKFLGGMYALRDGSVVFANWQGHGTADQPHIFHVSRDKQLIESFGPHDAIKTVSSVVVIGRRNRLSDYGH